MFWKTCLREASALAILITFASPAVIAQQSSEDVLSKILDRLNELEKRNEELVSEVKALREQLQQASALGGSQSSTLQEKLDVAEQRINEQAQTKVEASERFPISLTGTFLFDAFAAKGTDSTIFRDLYGDYSLDMPGAGATLNQSIIGLEFHGPRIFQGGRINGLMAMDFGGQESSTYGFRIRRGYVSFEWKNRTITLGQDKSIVAPLQPTSFARVRVPPLSGSGNLWLWRPQVTYEERLAISKSTRATLQGSVFETDESYLAPSGPGNLLTEQGRPAVQARVQLQHDWTETSKISIGIAGSGSTSHILGQSVPSRVISADFVIKPSSWFELSGTILHGKNFANLGGIPPGATISNNGQTVVPIRGSAGWLQAAFPFTKRLTLDLYAGKQVNNPRDLSAFEVLTNQTFAGNVLYRVAPNVVLGFEAARNRTEYLNALSFWTNRYDATVAYLF